MVNINLKSDALVEVFNDAYGVVGYSTDKVSRDFPKDTMKKVTLAELEDVINSQGGRALFEKNRLLIKDEKIRTYFDLPELGHYNLTKEGIKTLLEEGSLTKLEEVLMYCSQDVLEKLVQEAIAIQITSIPQASLIKSYSGIDIMSLIEESKPKEVARKPADNTPTNKPYVRKKVE